MDTSVANRLPKGQALVALAEQVQAMVDSPGYRALRLILEHERELLQRRVQSSAGTMAHHELTHRLGHAHGLAAMEEAVETVLVKAREWAETQARKHEGT